MTPSRCRHAARALLAVALPLVGAGCGPGNVARVSGRVTVDGSPAANVLVTFQPLGSAENPNPGPGSYGKTDADGRYHLTLVGREGRLGAFVGKHRVELRPPVQPNPKDPDGPPAATMTIPKEYNYESKLQFDVPKGGTTTADFDIQTRKG
jgi:hypothetical protein